MNHKKQQSTALHAISFIHALRLIQECWTPLHAAVVNRHTATVNVLIEEGANRYDEDKVCLTAFLYICAGASYVFIIFLARRQCLIFQYICIWLQVTTVNIMLTLMHVSLGWKNTNPSGGGVWVCGHL